MKRLFLSIFLLYTGGTHAQSRLDFGPEVGVGISDMKFAPIVGFTADKHQPIPAAKIGLMGNLAFNAHVYFQSGLSISTAGQKRSFSFYDSDTLNDNTDQTVHLFYADVPLNILFKSGSRNRGRFFFGAGVTFSLLLNGTIDQHSTGAGDKSKFDVSEHFTISGGANSWPIYDVGANALAGYEWTTGWVVKLYYTTGTIDLGHNSEIDKNRRMGVSIGYFLKKAHRFTKDANDLIEK